MSIDDMTRLQRDDADRLDRVQARLRQARQEHERILSRYGDDRGATATAVREEQDAVLADVEREVAATADAVRRNTHGIQRQLESAAGPALTADELQRAALLREEIKEDVAQLDAATLRDRMVAALTTGDKASMHHLVRYVPLRDFGPGTGAAGEPQALSEISALVAKMKDALRDTALDSHREVTRALLGTATDVHLAATRRRSQQEADAAVVAMNGGRRGVPIPDEDAS
jgi:ElaB/YqjD/DUF883 family membrane-anchored ribosome-binding protein